MSPGEETPEVPEQEFEDFVPAVVARSIEEAEEYRELLSDHDIPAIIGQEEEEGKSGKPPKRKGLSPGIPVLVPDVLLDEASEVIADREDVDEFVEAEGEEGDEEEETEEVAGPADAEESEEFEADDDESEEEEDEEDDEEEDPFEDLDTDEAEDDEETPDDKNEEE